VGDDLAQNAYLASVIAIEREYPEVAARLTQTDRMDLGLFWSYGAQALRAEVERELVGRAIGAIRRTLDLDLNSGFRKGCSHMAESILAALKGQAETSKAPPE